MPESRRPYTRPPSTTSTWKYAKIRQRPKGQQADRPKGGRWSRRARLNPRERLTLTVTYRGGAECWVEIHARGEMGRFVGSTYLIDVLQEIWEGAEHYMRDQDAPG